jgi:hypothetical protein
MLEEHPLNVLTAHYARTEEEGQPMNATQLGEMMPVAFLNDTVSADLVDQIDRIHETHAAGNEWGKRIRQPIVRRYQIGTERVLTAIADLPGELFDQRTVQADDRQRLLRNYGTLLWVVDPVVTEFSHLLPESQAPRVMRASMRPAADVNADHDRVRRKRNGVQDRLARQLAELSGALAVDLGGTQQVLVCVTKADLVRLMLEGGRSLRDIGRDPDGLDHPGEGLGDRLRRRHGRQPLHRRRWPRRLDDPRRDDAGPPATPGCVGAGRPGGRRQLRRPTTAPTWSTCPSHRSSPGGSRPPGLARCGSW